MQVTKQSIPLVVGFLIPIACGGKTELGVVDTRDSGVDDDSALDDAHRDSAGRDGSIEPCAPDGVRVCGGSCPLLTPDQCPGTGCSSVATVSKAPEPTGACWSDMTNGDGLDLCYACRDGDACMQRDANKLVCVPYGVCSALYSQGNKACRYADKSNFTGAPLTTPSGPCPTTAVPGALCGGACGACPSWTEGPSCTGRSASRPFGVCAHGILNKQTYTCSVDVSGHWVNNCVGNFLWNGSQDDSIRCQVFEVGDTESRHWGLCQPSTQCRAAARAIGSLHCFTPNGVDDI